MTSPRKLSPAMAQCISDVANRAQAAPHGGKQAIYDAACAELGISHGTLHRYLAQLTVRPQRRQRSDAGVVSLSREDALTLSGVLMESRRGKGKKMFSVQAAIEALIDDGKMDPVRTDPATGEITRLSTSAIIGALWAYGLHPEQLLAPAPVVPLRSLHPNHVWQIDASICVLYYLASSNPKEQGLQVMDASRFYKNKPRNLARIAADRVWSYEITDHYSGAIAVLYVNGAESAENLTAAFIHAICQRPGDPFHGVPLLLMLDKGSANTSGAFKNLARRLQVTLLPHAAENARATGQVEKARDLIEREFESGLRFRPVADLEELNRLAQTWAIHFNARRTHSRHGQTRLAQWLTIQPEQLRIAPPPEVCRDLVTHAPQERRVTPGLTVNFRGDEYNVENIPGVAVGESLLVSLNPWSSDSAVVIDTDADGNELLHTAPRVSKDAAGFRLDGNVIGESWAPRVRTVADDRRDEVELHTMQASTLAEAKARRKAKALPMGGEFNPYVGIERGPGFTPLPKRGTDLPITTTVAARALRTLNHFEAASELLATGLAREALNHALIRQWHPDGVPEVELDALRARLTDARAQADRPRLRIINSN